MKNYLLWILCIFLIIPSIKAQFFEIGGIAGVFSFDGDVNEGAMLENTNAAFGGFFKYNVHPRIALEFSFLKGTLEAKDRSSKNSKIRERNLSFRSDLMEFALIPTFNILPFLPQKAKYFAPYLGLGIGVILFNPMTKYEDKWVELQKIGTEGQGLEGYQKPYSLIQMVIPVLFGIKYSIAGRFNISIEVGYRFTTTDYLDDVSTMYIAPKQLASNGELAVLLSNRTEEYTGLPANDLVGTRRGNANNNDAYLNFGVRLSFNLFTKKALKAPKTEYKFNKWF